MSFSQPLGLPQPFKVPEEFTRFKAAKGEGYFSHHGLWAPGVRVFRNMGFKAKASVICLGFMLPMLALMIWLLQALSEQAMQSRMDATRQHVEVAHGILSWAYTQETDGKLSREQAQTLAKQEIAKLRYNEREYYWINDMQPRMVMHPTKPELDGKDLSNNKDPNGFALFNAFVAKVKESGKGFVAYQWPKPGSDKPVDKLSYVQGFEPWGWIVGTGIYIDDLRAATLRRVELSAGIAAFVLLGTGYLFLSFYRVMNGGLVETRRHLQAMSSGDLTTTPKPWGRDEISQLMHELSEMQGSLREMVRGVRASSHKILHSSSEITHGAEDLSARTEQAAANLEESAASMEQISATVKQSAALTADASQVARRNADVARDGARVIEEVAQTMDGIRGASARIGEIIGTVDSIAFQTNILALNAAVEAARAGEQGRGFAVVASEVRMLAQRSADAAKEIKGLIGSSVEQVETGSAIVRRAGQTMADIVSASQQVDQVLDEIAGGAREQSLGINQIGQAVAELDRMTQQNAALVEETVAAAAAMQRQAQGLAGQVERFNLP
ncbi:chemotaxis protein [Paucibacter sp. KBW04]|uniref:methyl-accepting chemotaxis protein n=1 Tax=Paucibacter sp. KBW04 TaxID=2153361 RepID=UPI000F574CE1|nr:methyl-accepting chemotaxis protein [Paucibacter sp. KBW04]RQO62538.1 chemotaxis protein [Paucibacter sp. KBW04]